MNKMIILSSGRKFMIKEGIDKLESHNLMSQNKKANSAACSRMKTLRTY